METSKKKTQKSSQIKELQRKLSEAESNLEAISSGKADAIVVHTDSKISVFTIQGAETAYRIMVETMNEGAITLDSNGLILYVNPKFCTMLDTPCSSLVGKRIQTFIQEKQRERFELFLKKTAAGSNVHNDFELIKPNLSTLPVYFSSAPLEITGRNDICIVASDLTERLNAKKTLIELNNTLEAKVAERTAELQIQKKELENSQTQLKNLAQSLEQKVEYRTSQVRDLAKALTLAEQKQRQNLSNILHEELQQMLFSSKTRFELLKETVEQGSPEELKEDIEELELLILKALQTTRRLAIEFNPPVLSNEGLDASLKWLAHHIEQQYGLKVGVSISEGFRIIREDERILVVQLVRELLHNTIKYAKTDKAHLTVTRDKKHIFIEVYDKGVGFDVEREKRNRKEKKQMGLFSIEERLRLFGGKIKIESKPGKGTRIIMSLPYDPKINQLTLE
ncbi:sensory box histidine kinase [Chitinispirillum alkaliphilum]|nr:sensory box histidine kinase [Chitinispirillum alkaliphilum]